jgi:hypothetical protein
MNSYRRSFLIGLGGFVIALLISNLATLLVFASGLLSFLINFVPEGQPLIRILRGVMLAFIGIGIGGAAGGAVRGYFLQRVDYQGSRSRYVTAGAFTNGSAHGILVIPTQLFIGLVSIYNVGSGSDPTSFLILFGLIGGLLEFKAATTSPEASDTYRKMFDYYWQRAIPAQDASWGSTGNYGNLADRLGTRLADARFHCE